MQAERYFFNQNVVNSELICIFANCKARVVELVDTPLSGGGVSNDVQVQVLSRVLFQFKFPLYYTSFRFCKVATRLHIVLVVFCPNGLDCLIRQMSLDKSHFE